MIDYESIISTVIGVIRDSTGRKVIMENGTGKRPFILLHIYRYFHIFPNIGELSKVMRSLKM
ncbi:hypothetical protein ACEQPO_08040 [Bacillus sp. SL00103]